MIFDAYNLIIGKEENTMFPAYTDRPAWLAINPRVRDYFLKKGEKSYHNITKWKPITMLLYTEYARTGIRANYERVYFKRRFDLAYVVLCECLEGKGKYLTGILNGLNILCAEESWCLPAHNPDYLKSGTALPTVDLFASDTAALIALTLYLLDDALADISKADVDRIKDAMEVRVKTPYLIRNDFWWMGYDESRKLNNWSSWISANMLTIFAFTEDTAERIIACAKKAVFTLDKLYTKMPDDGECDEGVAYWNVSQAALFDSMQVLHHATGGKWCYQNNNKFTEMARFPYVLHIADMSYVNFGDCSRMPGLDYPTIFRFAQATGNADVAAYAKKYYLKRSEHSCEILMLRALSALFADNDMKAALTEKPVGPVFTFYKKSRLLAVRSYNDCYFAAKGSGADGGHSHQDIGNFIFYKNGRPIAIDVGNESYTKASFSKERGMLWYVRSDYHNLPSINGIEQREKQSTAQMLSLNYDKDDILLQLDMATAYENAGLERYERVFEFSGQKGRLCVRNKMAFSCAHNAVDFHIMTCSTPTMAGGKIAVDGCEIQIEADSAYEILVEELPIKDELLRRNWGGTIYRIILRFLTDTKNLCVNSIFC